MYDDDFLIFNQNNKSVQHSTDIMDSPYDTFIKIDSLDKDKKEELEHFMKNSAADNSLITSMSFFNTLNSFLYGKKENKIDNNYNNNLFNSNLSNKGTTYETRYHDSQYKNDTPYKKYGS